MESTSDNIIDTIIQNIKEFINVYNNNSRDDSLLIKKGSLIIKHIANLNQPESATNVQDLISNIFPSRIIASTTTTAADDTSSDEGLTDTSEQYADFMSSIIISVNNSLLLNITQTAITSVSIDETISQFSFSWL